MRSDEGLDEDYFIKAQDYLDDWERSVVADKAISGGETASVVLQLGAKSDTRRKFSVTLAREDGVWKIQSVQLMPTPLNPMMQSRDPFLRNAVK